MKSVLMIAYYFPPEGSAGAYRPLRFVRHLSKKGWHISVITANPYRYERYDPDLLGLLPSETEIVRVRGHDGHKGGQGFHGATPTPPIAREGGSTHDSSAAGTAPS